jgi:hypothetical protein
MADIQLLQIKDVMTNRPARIRHDANSRRATEIVSMSRVSDLKHALRESLKVFEEPEGEAINQSIQRLVETARAVANLLKGYYARVCAGIQKFEAAEVNMHSVASRMKSSEVFKIMSMVDLDPVGEQRTPLLSC